MADMKLVQISRFLSHRSEFSVDNGCSELGRFKSVDLVFFYVANAHCKQFNSTTRVDCCPFPRMAIKVGSSKILAFLVSEPPFFDCLNTDNSNRSFAVLRTRSAATAHSVTQRLHVDFKYIQWRTQDL